MRDALGLPTLGKILDSQRNLTFECRTAPTANTGTYVVTCIVAFFAIIVITSSVLDAMISSKSVEAYITHHSYDQGKVPFMETIETNNDNIYFDDDSTTVLSVNVSEAEQTPLLKAAYGKPSDVIDTISSATFKVTQLQIVLCYIIQFLIGWSAIKNFKALFYQPSDPTSKRFEFMHGIKVCASLWMVLGMTIFYVPTYGWINVERLSEAEQTFFYQLYANSCKYFTLSLGNNLLIFLLF